MGHAPAAAPTRHKLRLGRAFGAQAVVHGDGQNLVPRLPQKMQKGDGITAARQGQSNPFRSRKNQPPGQPYGHPRPCMAIGAWVAAMVPGYCTDTSASVTQASGVWPSVPSDWPSFNSASAAKPPCGSPE